MSNQRHSANRHGIRGKGKVRRVLEDDSRTDKMARREALRCTICSPNKVENATRYKRKAK